MPDAFPTGIQFVPASLCNLGASSPRFMQLQVRALNTAPDASQGHRTLLVQKAVPPNHQPLSTGRPVGSQRTKSGLVKTVH